MSVFLKPHNTSVPLTVQAWISMDPQLPGSGFNKIQHLTMSLHNTLNFHCQLNTVNISSTFLSYGRRDFFASFIIL